MNVYEEMKIEFDTAMSCLTVERGLSDLEKFKERYQKAFDAIVPKHYIKFGNRKVPRTTMICNTTSWFLCPGRLFGFCEIAEDCYDKCWEVMGSACKSRLNHDLWWRQNDSNTIAQVIILEIKMFNLENEEPCNLIRFQEVGDFRTQEDLEKMIEVSNIVFNELGINSYTYTHNRSLNFDVEREHLCICGSGFMVDNQFSVIPKEDIERYIEEHPEAIRCPQKCKLCNSVCSRKLGIEIVEVLR